MSITTDLRRSPGGTVPEALRGELHRELRTAPIGDRVAEKHCHLMRPTPRRTPAR